MVSQKMVSVFRVPLMHSVVPMRPACRIAESCRRPVSSLRRVVPLRPLVGLVHARVPGKTTVPCRATYCRFLPWEVLESRSTRSFRVALRALAGDILGPPNNAETVLSQCHAVPMKHLRR